MKSYPQKNLYIYISLLVLIPVAIYWGALIMLRTERSEAERLETMRIIDSDNESLRSTLRHEYEDTENHRRRLDDHFVRKDDIVDFVNGLEELGALAGVEANISSLGESWQDERGGTLQLSLHVIGEFTELYNYILLLEQVPQKLVIGDISLSARGAGPTPATIKAITNTDVIWTAEVRATVIHYTK